MFSLAVPSFRAIVLQELFDRGFSPTLVVTEPDARRGRDMAASPSVVKSWATAHTIEVAETADLKNEKILSILHSKPWDIFIVASYGHIIPKTVLEIPKRGTLNVHPSLLPKLRGPSPLQTAILQDIQNTGVSIMVLNEEMDHGPIIVQEAITVARWPQSTPELELTLGKVGGKLLADILPKWNAQEISATPQDHANATYTKKISKEDGLLNLTDNAYLNFRKIKAYERWPKAYFIIKKKNKEIRVVINKANYKNNILEILRVTPEGKQEMDYKDFAKGYL